MIAIIRTVATIIGTLACLLFWLVLILLAIVIKSVTQV